ncbi:MAG: ATP-dependent DNA helicase RecQ [Deltaproteobacteria bacterium]|nr:ATP-dependent DNA helicase RecQ [Deltaproteobacteria bacterium]MBI3296046.1 ATP-dependent DNA helicase RecQ [Deltaproteobacteria bacterium]
MNSDLVGALKKSFHLPGFRKGQREIIESLLNNKDALAVMPTGGGKSLCYQLPALLRPGIVVVISPLIALMENQVQRLRSLGISAVFLHSGQSVADKRLVFSVLKRAESSILYLSPERVQKDGFRNWITAQKVSLFAIDEAHCVSQWGPDFREDYYKLGGLRELLPEVPIVALTASATPEVLEDIIRQLQLRKPDRHIHGFYRPNLYYQVELCSDEGIKIAIARQAISQNPEGRILIYCGTRKQTETVSGFLSEHFGKAAFYHAGMSSEDRTCVQTQYQKGEIRILAATNAFGMGIDHPDVRLVVHFQMPANVEHYYQEMGRAGRDGKPSACLLLYSKKDKGLHSYFITQSNADKNTIRRRWSALEAIVQFAEGGECRHSGILTYFRDSFRLKDCGHCDVCDPSDFRHVQKPKFEVASLPKIKKKETKEILDVELTAEEEIRFEMLREWRKVYATENDIAPFMVFSNKTLKDLVRRNPKTLEELSKVYGFGPHKTEYIGPTVLARLQACD